MQERTATESLSESINKGFSKQSYSYDEADRANIVLQDLRKQVYRHVESFLRPGSQILELNGGTGLDAVHFASEGHFVHVTDLSDGMIAQIRRKIERSDFANRLTCEQLSYEHLDRLGQRDFDYVFSNFGGLNCSADLTRITRHLPMLLKPGGYATFVIMPPVCLWEWLLIFKGQGKRAFRRLRKGGTLSYLEGEHFYTHYYSLADIRRAFGPQFKFIRSEGLAALSPPPHRHDIPLKHPRLYKFLRSIDYRCKDIFPFNRWADHIVVTMQHRK